MQPRRNGLFTSELRNDLLPLVMKNAQSRSNYGETLPPEKVQDGVREALTTKFCESFLDKMRSIQTQMSALRSTEREKSLYQNEMGSTGATIPNGSVVSKLSSNAFPFNQLSTVLMPPYNSYERPVLALPTPPVSTSLSEPPKAPKAMRLRQQSSNGSNISPLNQLSERPLDHLTSPKDLGTKVSHREAVPPYGIPIPMDPAFFAPHSDKEEKGKARSVTPPSQRPDDHLNPRQSMSGSRQQRPLSPHTSSSVHSPTVSHRRYSSSSRTREPTMRHHRSRSRSPGAPPDPRPRRFSRSSRSPLRRNTPPRYVTAYMRRKLSCRSDERPPRFHLSPSPPRPRPLQPNHRRLSRSPPPRYHDHTPQQASRPLNIHSREQDVKWYKQKATDRRSSSRSAMLLSSSPQRPEPAHGPVKTNASQNINVLHDSPRFVKREPDNEDENIISLPRDLLPDPNTMPELGSLVVPGLWFMKTGYHTAHVLDCTFDIDERTATQWDISSP